MIQTKYKSKLSKSLAYPIGTEALNRELRGVPQIATLGVSYRASPDVRATKFLVTRLTRGRPGVKRRGVKRKGVKRKPVKREAVKRKVDGAPGCGGSPPAPLPAHEPQPGSHPVAPM